MLWHTHTCTNTHGKGYIYITRTLSTKYMWNDESIAKQVCWIEIEILCVLHCILCVSIGWNNYIKRKKWMFLQISKLIFKIQFILFASYEIFIEKILTQSFTSCYLSFERNFTKLHRPKNQKPKSVICFSSKVFVFFLFSFPLNLNFIL